MEGEGERCPGFGFSNSPIDISNQINKLTFGVKKKKRVLMILIDSVLFCVCDIFYAYVDKSTWLIMKIQVHGIRVNLTLSSMKEFCLLCHGELLLLTPGTT